MKFSNYALSQAMLQALTAIHFEEPTPVQEVCIPKILKGHSLIARYATGTGKTHAFLIPVMDRLTADGGLQAIVVVPTRELANQTFHVATELKSINPLLKIRLLTGGVEKERDYETLKNPPHLLVATPGRLTELLQSPFHQTLIQAHTIVLDEADMLLDAVFFATVDRFLSLLKNPQILVFSASIPKPLQGLIRKYIRPDYIFEEKNSAINPERVTHGLVNLHHRDPYAALKDFLDYLNPYLALVFASKVDTVEKIAQYFRDHSVDFALLHGDLPMRERRHTLRAVQEGKYKVVVASDIASRGLDIPAVSDVISFDLPIDLQYYFHRAGRTARYNLKGRSFVFYNEGDQSKVDQLKQQGIRFALYSFKDKIFKEVTTFDTSRFVRTEDPTLKNEIRKAIALTKSSEVKPGYRKKVRLAIEKVKRKYKRKAIQKIIRNRLYKTNPEE